jgi:hypothetical protein
MYPFLSDPLLHSDIILMIFRIAPRLLLIPHSFLCGLALLVLPADQKPDWVRNPGISSQYPEREYLTGYGICAEGAGTDHVRSAAISRNSAKRNVIERLRVFIHSTSADSISENRGILLSSSSMIVQATSGLEISGLGWVDFFDEEHATWHTLAYLSRSLLDRTCEEKARRLSTEINRRFDIARHLEESRDLKSARDHYIVCFRLLHELEEARVFQTVARSSGPQSTPVWPYSPKTPSEHIFQEALVRLNQGPATSLEDLSYRLVRELKEQVPDDSVFVLTRPPSLRNTEIGSSFSYLLGTLVNFRLHSLAHWSVAMDSRALQNPISPDTGTTHVLDGTYWEGQDDIKVMLTLYQRTDRRIMGIAESNIAKSILQIAGIDWQPRNLSKAIRDQARLSQGEQAGNGLCLDAWTSKGIERIILRNGERIRLFLRVNHPCYIRCIYHLVDGRRTLLVDNYKVEQKSTNTDIALPYEFECAAPFGVEVIQMFAQTTPFSDARTSTQEGYTLLVDDIEQVLAQTRGITRLRPLTLQAESRITVTTLDTK